MQVPGEIQPTHPSGSPLTHTGELCQLGWISGGLPGICSPRNLRTETAPAGTGIPGEGLTN
ncbi:hypothetical protein Slala05_58540 [Streptomyces lavendulae subsp. lavendulae]|nr:hypothetical protein Slala05_58540 [Streptomyces lavendulae subsp. lavendulae]